MINILSDADFSNKHRLFRFLKNFIPVAFLQKCFIK